MKKILIHLVCFFLIGTSANAQLENTFASFQDSFFEIDKVLSGYNLEDRLLVGVGDVGEFANEPKALTRDLVIYLVEKKGYRNILLHMDDWTIRPLNAFLQSQSDSDVSVMESWVRKTFSRAIYRNREFEKIFVWLKDYNIANPSKKVNVYGVAPSISIPPSYFLSQYIFEIDSKAGERLSKKWTDSPVPDSIAFSDIKSWVNDQLQLNISDLNKELLNMCIKDLDFNDHLPNRRTIDQQLPLSQYIDYVSFVSRCIFDKLAQKSIYISSNADILNADIQSSLVIGGHARPTVGHMLHHKLKNKYFNIITDFADSSALPLVEYKTMEFNTVKFGSSDKARELFLKKRFFDAKYDVKLLKGYTPSILAIAKEVPAPIPVSQERPMFDLLFIFRQLTSTYFFN
ncbi:erythromycin esterase family protein [Sphingobacterium sp. SYP-B4668]|uniref:erythromycin esterase family protein n=1 Tax=Sphingobacterium sp. SYP-B4668 TaxID=2996035 RepID=UPI0022DD7A5E|nr:erythromycin esterase family protein [Sphingobacterium sp. SYP-B4668]